MISDKVRPHHLERTHSALPAPLVGEGSMREQTEFAACTDSVSTGCH